MILRHNRAVVNYYKGGCTQHQTLLQELEQLSEGKSGTASGTSGSTVVVGGLSLKNAGSAITVARYNKAVIYYHRHMYGTALERLAPLVTRLEALEKNMSALVATLQLQLLLATNQLNRAEAFLDYLQYKLNLVASAPSPSPTPNPNTSSNQNSSSSSTEEATSPTATSVATGTNSAVAVSATGQLDGSVARVAGDSTLQLLQLLTLVLNRKPVVITEDGTPQIAALKAQQYYIMKDFQMAAKQLMRINNECTQAG